MGENRESHSSANRGNFPRSVELCRRRGSRKSRGEGGSRQGHRPRQRPARVHRLRGQPPARPVRVQCGHGFLLRGLAAGGPAAGQLPDRPGRLLDHARQLRQQGHAARSAGHAGPDVARPGSHLGQRVPDRGGRLGLLGRQPFPLRPPEVQHERHAAMLRLRGRIAGLVLLLQQRSPAGQSPGHRAVEQPAADSARCAAVPGASQRPVPGLHVDGPALYGAYHGRPAHGRPELDLLPERGQLQGAHRLLHSGDLEQDRQAVQVSLSFTGAGWMPARPTWAAAPWRSTPCHASRPAMRKA